MSVRYKIKFRNRSRSCGREQGCGSAPRSFTATADKYPDPAFSKLDPGPDPGSKAQNDVFIKKHEKSL